MTTPARTAGRRTPIEVLLRQAAIPATACVIVDLDTRRPVAIKVSAGERGDALDGVTIARVLHAIEQHRGRPDAPVVFEVPIGTLLSLQAASRYSDHPLLLSLDADELLDHPARSLRLVERAREFGWEIGLHGIGGSIHGLSAVSIFEPSLVTTSAWVLADPTAPAVAEMLHAMTAFRHASGATLMAEGLDSAELVYTARSLGATIGRGEAVPSSGSELPSDLDYTLDLFVSPPMPDHHQSPYDLSTQRHQPQRARPALLVSMSRHIESTAENCGRSAIMLSTFQHVRRITPATREIYARLAGRVELIMMGAGGLRSRPVPGVCWTDLPHHDHLRQEWVVLVLGPTTSTLLAAREVRRRRRPTEREFDYVLSYDRDLVAHAARSLLTRLPRRNDR